MTDRPKANPVRVAVVRPAPDTQQLVGAVVGRVGNSLLAAKMIQKLFGVSYKRALGFVALYHWLTDTPSEYPFWTHR